MHASLCGGGYLLKALGSVAHYLADGIFYSTNDTFFCASFDFFQQMFKRFRVNTIF